MQDAQPTNSCAIHAGATRPMVRVALMDPVDPQHAPVPRNDSERLLFRQLYQTLVSTDCNGDVIPELAESWSSFEDGRVWEFRLRGDATFWDGTPVTPQDVMRSWSEHGFAAAVAGMAAVGDHELRVELRSPTSHVSLFANPNFAVARRDTAASWPVGSSSFRIDDGHTQRVVRTMSREQVIEFHLMSTTDPRSALDAGVDALITADAATLDYARALPDYAVTPLAWNRTYAFVTARTQSGTDTGAASEALLGLARDAIRADTRAARPPFSWQDRACRARTTYNPPSNSPKSNAIVYPANDAIAKGIAERLVAFAWPTTRAPGWLRTLLPPGYTSSGAPTALGLDDGVLAEWLRTNRALGFVVALPRDADCSDHMTDSYSMAVAPILDARDQLIHRGNLGRVLLTGDGVVRFDSGIR